MPKKEVLAKVLFDACAPESDDRCCCCLDAADLDSLGLHLVHSFRLRALDHFVHPLSSLRILSCVSFFSSSRLIYHIHVTSSAFSFSFALSSLRYVILSLSINYLNLTLFFGIIIIIIMNITSCQTFDFVNQSITSIYLGCMVSSFTARLLPLHIPD